MIDDLPRYPRAVDLIDGIIRIARGLGLHVVAEGVETEAQRAMLKESGEQYGPRLLLQPTRRGR